MPPPTHIVSRPNWTSRTRIAFGIPAVVTINSFPTDTTGEVEAVREVALAAGARDAVVATHFVSGGEGAAALAQAVWDATASGEADFKLLYPDAMAITEKIETIATRVYGADGIDLLPAARKAIKQYEDLGFGHLPICMAKTQYSLSHDAGLKSRPSGFRVPTGGPAVRWCRVHHADPGRHADDARTAVTYRAARSRPRRGRQYRRAVLRRLPAPAAQGPDRDRHHHGDRAAEDQPSTPSPQAVDQRDPGVLPHRAPVTVAVGLAVIAAALGAAQVVVIPRRVSVDPAVLGAAVHGCRGMVAHRSLIAHRSLAAPPAAHSSTDGAPRLTRDAILVLTRHGLTDRSVPEQHLGQRLDVPLNEAGRAQAKALATRLQGVDFDRVISSRSSGRGDGGHRRPHRTRRDRPAPARDGLRSLGRPHVRGARARPRHGTPPLGAGTRHPALPGRRVRQRRRARVRDFLDELLAKSRRAPRRGLGAGAAGAGRRAQLDQPVLVCVALGLPSASFRQRFVQGQANITVLRFEHGDGPSDVRLLVLNDTAHLQPAGTLPWS